MLVNVQGIMHQALLDSRSSQTLIHQSLVRPKALVDVSWVTIGCIHEDLHDYPLVTLEISHQGLKHRIKAAVSSRLTCALLLRTDWLGFITAVTSLGCAVTTDREMRMVRRAYW